MYPVPYVFLVFGKESDPQYERATFFFKLGFMFSNTDRIKFSKDKYMVWLLCLRRLTVMLQTQIFLAFGSAKWY